MRSELDLERALAAAGLRAPVRWEEVTGSTSATAYELAMGGAPEWTLVAAGHQTAGRGRLGRSWEDEPGTAILCSVVLRPSMPAEVAGQLTLLAGAAWAEAARSVTGMEVACAWPNDLVIGEAKVGGILAESLVEGDVAGLVVLGCGINLVPPVAVDRLIAGLGGDADRVALLGAFLASLRSGYEVPRERFPDEVRARWLAVNGTLGRRVEVIRDGAPPLSGRALDLDRGGALLVETDTGPERVAFGDVVRLR